MHVYDLAWTREGAVSGLARCGAWLSAHVSPQWGTGARAKALWRQAPELLERLRRLTSAGRGTPGRDHGSRPCSRRAPRCREHGEGWSRGRLRASTPQLGGRDEALPREAPEGSRTACSLLDGSTCRRPRHRTKSADGAPIFTSSLGPLSGQRRLSSGGDKMCLTRGHVGSLLVGKKLYA